MKAGCWRNGLFGGIMTHETEPQAMEARAGWDICLEHLQAGYPGRVVLHDISAQFPSGAITAVLGESGCGKSTLLRHLIGLSRPMAGKILYGGRDFFDLPQAYFRRIRRRFGVLFQDGALLGSLTLAENVALPLGEHTKLPAALLRETAMRTLELVGLRDFADYYPHELSGGMRKRGGLARAIVTEPPVLFCDEPTSGLDPINAAQMDQLLLDMKMLYPSMTLVVVTHDLASVRRIADHVILVREGGVGFAGTVEALEASEDAYLRRFMDRIPNSEQGLLTAQPVDARVRSALDEWLKR